MKEARCKSCGKDVEVLDGFHAGFSDEGFLYCDRDSTVVTWFAYDPVFDRIVGKRKMPWTLTEEEKRRVEDHLIGCPCGGKFLFENPLKCPLCGGILSEPMSKTIYCVVVSRRIDGEKTSIWKDRG